MALLDEIDQLSVARLLALALAACQGAQRALNMQHAGAHSDERFVRFLHAIPAIVAVHCVVAPHHSRDRTVFLGERVISNQNVGNAREQTCACKCFCSCSMYLVALVGGVSAEIRQQAICHEVELVESK